MTSLAKKNKGSAASFLRRKRRVNTSIKAHGFSHRLLVNRSNLYTYAQVIDAQGRIILGMSDKTIVGTGKVGKAFELGKQLAAHCQKSGITTLTFDRNGYLYHGRVKALADGAREGGLMF